MPFHQHLLQLAAVRIHRQSLRGERELTADVLAQQSLQQGRRLAHHVVEVEALELDHFAAGEQQQLQNAKSNNSCKNVKQLQTILNLFVFYKSHATILKRFCIKHQKIS